MNTYISKNTYVSYIHNKLISRKQRSRELKSWYLKKNARASKSLPIWHVNIIEAWWHNSSNDHESKPRLLSTLADKSDVTNQNRSQDVTAHTTVPCPLHVPLPQHNYHKWSRQVHRGCILSRSSTGRVRHIILLMVGSFYHCRPFWHVQKYCCSSTAAACCSSLTKIATSTSSV